MEAEWPVWKLVVEKGISLTEIDRWDLEDIWKAHAIMEMKQDYANAVSAYEEWKINKE